MPDARASGTYPGGLDRVTLTAWRNGIFVVFGLAGFGMASWLSRIPTVRDTLHATTGEMGLLALGVAIGSIGGLAFAGQVVDRFGTRSAIAGSLALVLVSLPVAAAGASLGLYPLVLAGLIVFGVGTGVCDVSMNVSGASVERTLARSIMPLFHAVFSMGTVIGVATGAVAEALHIPVALHVGGATVVLLILALLALPRIHDERAGPPGGGAKPGWRERFAGWRNPRILFIGLIVLGMALSEGSSNDWLPLAFVDGHGVTNAAGAAVLAGFLGAMTVGRVVGTPLLDRFGRVPMLRASAALAALGLLAVVFGDGLVIAVLGSLLWGLGTSLGFPVGISAASDDPRRAAANVSTASTIGYLAFLAGPPSIGFLAEHVGILHALLLVLAMIAIAGVASGAARRRHP